MIKKFFKFVGICVVAIIALGVIIGIFSGGEDNEKSNSEPKQEKVEGKDKKESKKKEVKEVKIGETLKVGNVEFKVTKKSEAQNVGGEYGNNAKGKYLILDVTVTNKGDKALMMDSSFFKLKSNGKEYDADGEAGIYANSDSGFFVTDINPDLSLEGKVVFDIPAELHEKELVLNVQTGVFGTEQGEITLK